MNTTVSRTITCSSCKTSVQRIGTRDLIYATLRNQNWQIKPGQTKCPTCRKTEAKQ